MKKRPMEARVDWTHHSGLSRGIWLKGNLHTHAGEGMTVQEILARYAGLGYDFLCISDHMKLTFARHRSLLLIPGVEWNSPVGEHMTVCSFDRPALRRCVASTDQASLLRFLAKRPALVVLNHPNWREPPHYSREQLMERSSAAGVEAYNGLIERTAGTALATEKWDYLLSRGRLMLGFASDDAHSMVDTGQGWIMVRAAARSARAVLEAIRRGAFYCSTGVTIRSVRRSEAHITIDTSDAGEIWAVGDWGVRLARAYGRRMQFDVAGLRGAYVRFVAFGKGAAMAWTQPFFRDTPPEPGQVSPFVARWWMSRIESHRLSDAPAVSLDAPMEWMEAEALASPEGFVNVHRRFGSRDGVVYLANRFAVSKTGHWGLALGHDGGAKVFMDGACVIHQPLRVNPAAPDRSLSTVRLTRGTHEIVVVLDTDHGLGQGIFLRFIRPRAAAHGPRAPAFPTRLADARRP
jgi:hypothetical protein